MRSARHLVRREQRPEAVAEGLFAAPEPEVPHVVPVLARLHPQEELVEGEVAFARAHGVGVLEAVLGAHDRVHPADHDVGLRAPLRTSTMIFFAHSESIVITEKPMRS